MTWTGRIGTLAVVFALGFAGTASAEYTLEREWGDWGREDGQFGSNYGPQDMATDAAGNVYVVDTLNHRVQKFSPTGAFITKWGTQGRSAGQFSYPGEIAIDAADNVYVADMDNHRIQKFTASGAFVATWGRLGTADGEFGALTELETDHLGRVYAVSRYENMSTSTVTYDLQTFTAAGRHLATWDMPINPSGLAIDAGGYLYVGDGESGRILKFDPRKVRMTEWDSRAQGGYYTSGPMDITVDASGAVYATTCVTGPAADWWFVAHTRSVRKFTSTGELLTEWVTDRREESFWGYSWWCSGGGGSFNPQAEFLATDRFGGVFYTGLAGRVQKYVNRP